MNFWTQKKQMTSTFSKIREWPTFAQETNKEREPVKKLMTNIPNLF